MRKTATALVVWTLVAWFGFLCSLPATDRSYGKPLLVFAPGLFVLGAWLEAGQCRKLWPFAVYGVVGAAGFALLLLSSAGLAPWPWLSSASAPQHAHWFWMGILAAGLFGGVACMLVAALRHSVIDYAHEHRLAGRCAKCGYLLHGLPELRCPECGERFGRSV